MKKQASARKTSATKTSAKKKSSFAGRGLKMAAGAAALSALAMGVSRMRRGKAAGAKNSAQGQAGTDTKATETNVSRARNPSHRKGAGARSHGRTPVAAR